MQPVWRIWLHHASKSTGHNGMRFALSCTPGPTMIARKSLVALSLGLCLLTSCVVQRPAAAEPPRLPSESVAASVGASAAASAPPPSVAASPPPASAAPPASTPASRPALPKQLLIPAIHVDAPVERVGTTPEGAMDVPREWNDVGWFEKGY